MGSDLVGVLLKLAHHRWCELTDKALLGMLVDAAKQAAARITELEAALSAATAERNEARKLASLGCDANGGGEHSIIQQGSYKFCHRCGGTIKSPTLQERARNAEARAEAADAALSAEKAKVARYEARLEIDHCFVLVDGELVRQEIPAAEREGFMDGILARDATIKLQERRIEAAEAKAARLKEALRSIAANTCCDTCREAALVARAALGGEHG